MLSLEDKELLRLAALEVLVSCHPIPRSIHAIRRNVSREVAFQFTNDDLNSALEFLRGMFLITFQLDPVGTTKWWSAEPAGILQVERSASPSP